MDLGFQVGYWKTIPIKQTENDFDFIIKYLFQIHNFYLYPITSAYCLLITKRHILYKNKLKVNSRVHYTERI